MTPAPPCIEDGDTVSAAVRAMCNLGVSALPVCEEHRRFLGMLSDRDILERCVAAGLDPTVVCAGSLVEDNNPVSLTRNAPPMTPVLAMLFLHADGMPVVQDGLLVGMVGLVDVAARP